jgi:hypothetical protein
MPEEKTPEQIAAEQAAIDAATKAKSDEDVAIAAKAAADAEKTPEQLAADKAAEDAAKAAGGGTQETPEQKAEREKEHRQNRIQKRIDKLTAEKYELKGRVEAMERMQQQTRQQSQADEPVRDNFDSDLAYLEARQDYKIQKAALDRDEQSRQTQQQVLQANWVQKETAARAKYSDYDEVIADGEEISIPRAAGDAIAMSELGAELHYYLAKNPQEANRLMQLTNPIDQIRAIGQMEAKIGTAVQKPAKAPGAPPPIKPVNTNTGNVVIDHLDPNWKGSQGDWERLENERLRKKRENK